MDILENNKLLNRIREELVHISDIEEKKMFQGITFMVNGKLCISVSKDGELLFRVDPEIHDSAIEKNGTREMIHSGRVMKGFIFVSEEGYKNKKDFTYWVKKSLEYNPKAKAVKKKK